MSRCTLALCLIALCVSLASATDKKQLTDALAAVDANLKTPEGKRYDAQFGSDFSQTYVSSVRECKQREQGTPSEFDLLLRLKSDGKVGEVLVYPETTLAVCTRAALATGKFSAPPHDDYWVNLHMQFKK